MTELKEAIKKINSKTDLIKILNFYGVHFNKDNKAICPFHNEKTASLSIQEKNNGAFYHCFGCKEHGDIINFIRKKENLSTLEATKKAYGILGLKLDIQPTKLDKLKDYIEKNIKLLYREFSYLYD